LGFAEHATAWMRNIENFSGGIRDEIVLARPGFVTMRRRDVGYFELKCGMRDDIVQNVEQACTLPDRIRNEPFYELCTISGDQIHIEVFQAKRDSDTAN